MTALSCIVMLTCFGLAAGSAQSAYDSDIASKLIAMERVGKMQAWQNKDMKTLDTMFDDAFVYVDPQGRELSKSELIAYIQSFDSLQFIAEAMTVQLHGDTGNVTGLYRMKGAERKTPFVRQGRFVETWLYKNGQWVAIASLLTPAVN